MLSQQQREGGGKIQVKVAYLGDISATASILKLWLRHTQCLHFNYTPYTLIELFLLSNIHRYILLHAIYLFLYLSYHYFEATSHDFSQMRPIVWVYHSY
jgi:hypothetical protein